MANEWITDFPALLSLPENNKEFLQTHCQTIQLPAHQTVFAPDMNATNFLMLRRGSVKVSQNSANGREIILYRVASGETCILTTACLLSGESYNAEAITETDVEAILLPEETFNQLLGQSAEFRKFVFANYANRIASLMHLVEEVTFEKFDNRLAHKLLELANTDDKINCTHQQLATELGSAREVISRHLKEFERKGWIKITRGHIHLIDKRKLSSDTGHLNTA